MTIYIKNTETNKIIRIEADSYESLSKNFRQAPYEQCSDDEVAAEELREAKDIRIKSRANYFASNDWMAARLAKRGVPIPQEIKDQEILYASEIDIIESLGTIEEVEAYEIIEL